MNKIQKFILISGLTITGLIMFVLAIAISSENPKPESAAKDEAAWLIKFWEYGENYPYSIDDLTIMCQASAVWLENTNGDKYALNGIAKSMFKNDKKYKGGTDLILKPGKTDLFTPAEAAQRCLRLGK